MVLDRTDRWYEGYQVPGSPEGLSIRPPSKRCRIASQPCALYAGSSSIVLLLVGSYVSNHQFYARQEMVAPQEI